MHATTIQSGTPGPDLYKNTASDYCSFVRQKRDDDSNATGFMASKHVKVYGDGRCLFRCIATLLNRALLCARNEGGMALDTRLEDSVTSLADILRADTVQTLKANLHLDILDDVIKKALCEKQTGQFYSSLEERLTSVLSHDEYAGKLEIRGLVYSYCCPIFLYQL